MEKIPVAKLKYPEMFGETWCLFRLDDITKGYHGLLEELVSSLENEHDCRDGAPVKVELELDYMTKEELDNIPEFPGW